MLFRDAILKRIVQGEVSLAFRRWRRPTVRSGGTLRTSRGVLAIDEVRKVEPRDIDDREACAAGYDSRTRLLADLRGDGGLYRILLRYQGVDPRLALRETPASEVELDAVHAKLAALDRRAAAGAWTRHYLCLLRDHPGVRAADLAARLGTETLPFKAQVRKLKELGLTESLEVGYRLSPRGLSLLAAARW
jgi:hypothetical protein